MKYIWLKLEEREVIIINIFKEEIYLNEYTIHTFKSFLKKWKYNKYQIYQKILQSLFDCWNVEVERYIIK